MGLKKLTVISFLSLASVLLLAFTVVPHHHHQEYICFAFSHCQQDAHHDRHSHDNHGTKNNPGCVKNLLQTQVSRSLSLEHTCSEGHCHHFTIALFLAADILERLSQKANQANYATPFYREKLHAACYISDLSGRAPPYFC